MAPDPMNWDVGLLFGESTSNECTHASAQVPFDEVLAPKLDSSEVRRRWPRFEGTCPDCGCSLIKYASHAHYLLGDW
jgi:hypothetical protein